VDFLLTFYLNQVSSLASGQSAPLCGFQFVFWSPMSGQVGQLEFFLVELYCAKAFFLWEGWFPPFFFETGHCGFLAGQDFFAVSTFRGPVTLSLERQLFGGSKDIPPRP